MVKLTKRKQSNSEATRKKKHLSETKKINPFEVHQNKEKFKILGRKNKHDHGLPGVSRGKAVKKRKETLGQEFKTRNKTNKFMDHRIHGNFNNDEASGVRFAALQQNRFNKEHKKDLFNLNDEEVLTHKGQTLAEIEQFKNEASDESEVDEALDADFTKAAHFGGGDEIGNDRKSAIEDMIIEAKRRKAEVLKDKEEVLQMTSKLDENYKMLLPQLGKLNANFNKTNKPQVDEYDRIMREMIFEPRGEVTDKLQTQEQIEKKEKARLEKFENDRLARMKGDEIEGNKPTHISADDLDDGYFVESDEDKSDSKILAYDVNGETNLGTKNGNQKIEKLNGEDELELEEENYATDEDSEESDDLMDLKYSETSDEENTEALSKENKRKSSGEKKAKIPECNKDEEYQFGSEIPLSKQEFSKMMFEKTPETQCSLLQKLIQSNHPRLDGSNRQKIAKLFNYTLCYFDDIFNESCDIKNSFKILDQMMPHLFDMIQLNSESTSECILGIIKEKYEMFKKNTKKIPDIETIIIFKIISNLYSTSDFRHPIATPSIIFISQILTRSNVRSRKDISVGLFLVSIVLEFTNFSKRFLPASLNFLLGIILLSIPKKSIQVIKIIPPFESIAATSGNSVLYLKEKSDTKNSESKLNSQELITDNTIDDNFRVLILNTTLKLVNEYAEILNENIGGRYITEEFIKSMEQLNLENYPDFVKQNYVDTKNILHATRQKNLSKLVAPVRKPKALRLFEPRIEKVYNDKRRPKMSEEKTMRAILVHKIKRETKGAEREIRRDTQFLNKIKIKQQIHSDLERKEKVKRIFAEASVQQGELNALQRERKKTKF